MAAEDSTLHARAVAISRDYLGPAGERFIERQIVTHLGKDAEKLAATDIPELVNWVRLTFALLTDDTDMIDTFSERLSALAAPKSHERARKAARVR